MNQALTNFSNPSRIPQNYEPEISHLVKRASKDYVPNPFQSYEDYKRRISLKIKRNLIDDFHAVRDGYAFIGKYNQNLKDHLKTSSEKRALLQDLTRVNAAISEGKTFQDILGWSEEDIQEIYQLANTLFENKEYYESSSILKLLCLVQPLRYQFWLKAGDALEEENKNEEALISYYGGLRINPYAFNLHFGICFVLCKMNFYDEALQILEEAHLLIDETEKAGEKVDEIPDLREKLNKMHKIITKNK